MCIIRLLQVSAKRQQHGFTKMPITSKAIKKEAQIWDSQNIKMMLIWINQVLLNNFGQIFLVKIKLIFWMKHFLNWLASNSQTTLTTELFNGQPQISIVCHHTNSGCVKLPIRLRLRNSNQYVSKIGKSFGANQPLVIQLIAYRSYKVGSF